MIFNLHSSRTGIQKEIDAYRTALKKAMMKRLVDLTEFARICTADGLTFAFGAGGARSARLQYIPVVVERRR